MSACRLLNTYHDQLRIRVGLGEHIAQRDRAALPQAGHGLAECVHHGAGDRLVRGTVDSGAERCPLCLKIDGDLDSPRRHRAEMINEYLVGLVGSRSQRRGEVRRQVRRR